MPDESEDEHTLIHVICDECGEPDVLSILEHPRESPQVRMFADAHHTVAEEHADDTGHHVQVGETADTPDAVVDLAKSIAPSVTGVEPEDFSPELRADGGHVNTVSGRSLTAPVADARHNPEAVPIDQLIGRRRPRFRQARGILAWAEKRDVIVHMPPTFDDISV